MRNAFTLIELMIVIAIIAIIAAIAIPNLLESRVTSQEAAAASALRSGMLPGQVQFQAGAYCDLDGNGIGTFAVDGIVSTTTNPYNCLTGNATVGTSITLNLLAPSYGFAPASPAYSSANATATTTTSSNIGNIWPTISGYAFKTPVTFTAPNPATPSDGSGERVWAVLCFPIDDNQGRKFFMINQAGNVYMSKPASTASDGVANVGGCATPAGTAAGPFGTNMIGQPSSTNYLPYRR